MTGITRTEKNWESYSPKTGAVDRAALADRWS